MTDGTSKTSKELGVSPTGAGIPTGGLRVAQGGQAGQFQPGPDSRRASGRPKGSRNISSRSRVDLPQMIVNVAARAGFKTLDEKGNFIPGDEGCEGYLLWVALNDHKTYCALLARVLPYFVIPDIATKSTLSYDEAVAQLRERGLPPELIDFMRRAPDADELWPGENPDPYGMKEVTPNGTGKRNTVLVRLAALAASHRR
jgi:hypothetical protein